MIRAIIREKTRSLTLFGIALLAWTVFARPATAAAGDEEVKFDPVPCPAHPAFKEMPFSYTIGDLFGVSELPVKVRTGGWTTCPNPADCGNYLGNIQQERPLVGNENITRLSFSTLSFHFEPVFDYLEYGHRFPASPLPVETVNGKVDGWGAIWWLDIPLTGSLQEDQAFVRFHSDGSNEDGGLATWKIRFSCKEPSAPRPSGTLVPRRRATGFLLGDNDVVFLQVPAGWEPSGASDLHQTVALWPQDPQASADFDLYVRCNARPTPTVFDARGHSAFAQEFLHLRPEDCPGGIWNIAVHSFRGEGQFNVVAHSHKEDAHFSLEVAFDYSLTKGERDIWEDLLREAARFYYGMTEGTRILDTFRVYTGRTSCPFFEPTACGGHYCNLCLDPQTCRPSKDCRAFTYTAWPRHIQLYQVDLERPYQLPHELGHYDLGLPDEYEDRKSPAGKTFTVPKCGHTVMGLGFVGKEYNICFDGDHDTDGVAGPAGGKSGWQRISGSVPDIETQTPDNYPYNTFLFTGYPIGVVQEIP